MILILLAWAIVHAQQPKTDYLRSEPANSSIGRASNGPSKNPPSSPASPPLPTTVPTSLSSATPSTPPTTTPPIASPSGWARTDRPDSADKARGRTKDGVGSQGRPLHPDAKIVLYAKSRKLPFVTDRSFFDVNPLELPLGPKPALKITRGHLASNLEMKSLGDEAEGLRPSATPSPSPTWSPRFSATTPRSAPNSRTNAWRRPSRWERPSR